MDWTSLIVQVPLVAAFIWFALEMQKRYQDSMDKRDLAYLQAINQILDRLDHHDEVSQVNHNEIKAAIAKATAVDRKSVPKQ